jgi:hypothetical protein
MFLTLAEDFDMQDLYFFMDESFEVEVEQEKDTTKINPSAAAAAAAARVVK